MHDYTGITHETGRWAHPRRGFLIVGVPPTGRENKKGNWASSQNPKRGGWTVGGSNWGGRKTVGFWMSAFGGKADMIQGVSECLLLAISGHCASVCLL